MTMRADELKALAERVTRLDGPCRETDAEIAVESGLYVHEKRKGDRQMWFYPTTPGRYRRGLWSAGFERLDDFTASLDAAMTLVPEGYYGIEAYSPCDASHKWAVYLLYDGNAYCGEGASYALALTAAALLAKAAQIEGEGK